MRNLERNLSDVFFRQFLGYTNAKDADGYYTGGTQSQYSETQHARLCVSSARGTADEQTFGSLEDYDRTMTTADTACPINEKSVLWLDGADLEGPHNYVVTRRAVWKNSILYAVKQVTVSKAAAGNG